MKRVVALAIAVVVLGMIPALALAETPETKRLTLDRYRVTIEYKPEDEKVASKVASICEEALPSLSREIGLKVVQPFRVFLIPDIKAYEERMGLGLPPWGIAFAFTENQIMLVDVKRATDAWNSLERVIPHELSHLTLAQRTRGVRLPLWFVEGLAQWQAREWSALESWRLMESVWSNQAPRIDRLVSRLPAEESRVRDAYRVSYAAFQERFDKHTELLPGFLDEVGRHGDFGKAFEAYWNESEMQFYARFDEHLQSKYGSALLLFQTGPLFTLVSVLFVLVIFTKWIRSRRKLRRMEESEREWPVGGDD
jgi:hypothetical protein